MAKTIDSFYPDRIFVLEKYRDNDIVRNILSKYLKSKISFTITQEIPPNEDGRESIGHAVDSSKRTLLLAETSNFVMPPKGSEVQHCGGPRKIVAISNGCHFSCEYCYMQGTYRAKWPRIKFNLNYKDMLKELDKDITRNGRDVYNIGENQDSLAFDSLYPLSKILIPFFATKNAYLLMLTKSNCIDNLLGLKHRGHTIVSWSINSDFVTSRFEHGTASLDERVEAALKIQEAGYPLRLRFDPLMAIGDWERHYNEMLDKVFAKLKPTRITLGSLRFNPAVKRISKERFPKSRLFDSTHLNKKMDPDRKYRYKRELRVKLYRTLIKGVRSRANDIELALCKESGDVWQDSGLEFQCDNCKCHCKL